MYPVPYLEVLSIERRQCCPVLNTLFPGIYKNISLLEEAVFCRLEVSAPSVISREVALVWGKCGKIGALLPPVP